MDGKACLDKYFVFNKWFLLSCGLWPYQEKILKLFLQFIWMGQEMVIMIAKVIKLYEIKNDVDLIIEAGASLVYNVGTTVKFLNGIIYERKVKIILEEVQRDWNDLTDPEEIRILAYYDNLGKLLNISYICIVYQTLLLFMLLPLTPIILDIIHPLNESREREELIIAEFFVDQRQHLFTFMIYAYLTALYGIVPLLGTDTFYMNCVYHACGMLAVLGHRVKHCLGKEKVKTFGKFNRYEIKNCIIQHQKIIKFCDNINETYSTSFFIVLLINIGLMSVSGVTTTINLDEGGHFNNVIRFGMFTVAQIFHLLCYNLMGQNVLNSGAELEKQICDSYWYEKSLKTKQLIQFMILRNLRPIIMRATLFSLSLKNFSSVMKTTVSYFTVLKSTR